MKKLIAIVLLVLLVAALTGCDTPGKQNDQAIDEAERDNALFFVVSIERSGVVIVDKATRVMYWCSIGAYNYGTLTLLVNPDGTPRIWEDA